MSERASGLYDEDYEPQHWLTITHAVMDGSCFVSESTEFAYIIYWLPRI
ncbi:MAG TPA: hypothetical protein VFG45_01000 [Candidatus Nitrosocosmicus sp.]|nr:hypothetical protein [Candidatus Nitrosocosmicus sp.]